MYSGSTFARKPAKQLTDPLVYPFRKCTPASYRIVFLLLLFVCFFVSRYSLESTATSLRNNVNAEPTAPLIGVNAMDGMDAAQIMQTQRFYGNTKLRVREYTKTQHMHAT